MRKTVIIGATPNPVRAAFKAAERLKEYGEDFILVGIKKGKVFGKEILDLREQPKVENVDTVTLYVSQANQLEWEDYILSLKPKRILFNPGTENPELSRKADILGIETENACTLVLLSAGAY